MHIEFEISKEMQFRARIWMSIGHVAVSKVGESSETYSLRGSPLAYNLQLIRGSHTPTLPEIHGL